MEPVPVAPNLVSLTSAHLDGDQNADVVAAYSYYEVIHGAAHTSGTATDLTARASTGYRLVVIGAGGAAAPGGPGIIADQVIPDADTMRPGVLFVSDLGRYVFSDRRDPDHPGTHTASAFLMVAGTKSLQANSTEIRSEHTVTPLALLPATDSLPAAFAPLEQTQIGVQGVEFRRGPGNNAMLPPKTVPSSEGGGVVEGLATLDDWGIYTETETDPETDVDTVRFSTVWRTAIHFSSETTEDQILRAQARNTQTYRGREATATAIGAYNLLDNSEGTGTSLYDAGIGLFIDGLVIPVSSRRVFYQALQPETDIVVATIDHRGLYFGGDAVPANRMNSRIACNGAASNGGTDWSVVPGVFCVLYQAAQDNSSHANLLYQDSVFAFTRSVLSTAEGARRDSFITSAASGGDPAYKTDWRDYHIAPDKTHFGYRSQCDYSYSIRPYFCLGTRWGETPGRLEFRSSQASSIGGLELLPSTSVRRTKSVFSDGISHIGSWVANSRKAAVRAVIVDHKDDWPQENSSVHPAYLLEVETELGARGATSGNAAAASVLLSLDQDVSHWIMVDYHVEYSDPNIIAVLAAPPRFKDLEGLEEGDAFESSSTSFSTESGRTEEQSESGFISVGVFFKSESKIFGFGYEAEVETKYTHTWEKTKATTVSEAVTFGTTGGEDTVALTIVPYDTYVYEVYEVDENGEPAAEPKLASIGMPYAPITTTWEVGYYNEVAELYGLPAVGDDIIQHTPGRPETYVGYAADSRFDTVANKFMTTGYGKSFTTQSVTVGQEESSGQSNGFEISSKFGAGHEAAMVGVTAGGGAEWGSMTTEFSSTTVEGTMAALPRDPSRPPGQESYKFDWRLQARQIQLPGAGSFPFVTFGVHAVHSGPRLPDNLRCTTVTATTATLQWDQPPDPDATHYQVFADSGDGWKTSDEEWRVAGDETSIALSGLMPDTIYKFALIAVNETWLAPYDVSAVGPAIQVKTRFQTNLAPVVRVNEPLVTAPLGSTARLGVTVQAVAESDPRLTYRWEKYDGREWVMVTGSGSPTLAIRGVAAGHFGTYQCQVTERLDGRDMVAYSQAITLAPGKVTPVVNLTAALTGGETVGIQRDVFHLVATVTNPLDNRPASGNVVYTITGSHAGQPFAEDFSQYMYESTADRRWSARRWVPAGEMLVTELLDPGDYQIQAHYAGNESYEAAWSPVRRITIVAEDGPAPVVHTVSAGVDGGGTIAPAGEVPVTEGNSVTFGAKADDGHVFMGFEVDGQSVAGVSEAGGVFTHEFAAVSAAHRITARFSPILDLAPQEVPYDGLPHYFEVRVPEAAGLAADTEFAVSHWQNGAGLADPIEVGFYDVGIARPADSLLPVVDIRVPAGLRIIGGVPARLDAPTAVADQNNLTVTWEPPAHNGGHAIVSHTVTITDGDGITRAKAVGPRVTTATFPALGPNTYSATVHATNSVGDSDESEPSPAVPLGPSTVRQLVVRVQDDALAKGSTVVTAIEGFDQYGTSLGDLTRDCVITTDSRAVFVAGLSTVSRFVYTIHASYQVPGSNPQRTLTSEPVEVEIFDPASLVVVVTGTAQVGSTLRAEALVDWPLAYQWTRDDQPIPLATGEEYKLTAADAGHQVAAKAVTLYKAVDIYRSSSPVTVAKLAPSGFAVQLPKTAVTTGQRAVVEVSLATPGVDQPGGRITVSAGGVSASAPLAGGAARIALPKLSTGTYRVRADYSGALGVEAGLALSAQTLTVVRAAPVLAALVADTSISSGAAPIVTVKVTATGIAPTGNVVVAAGATRATAKLVKGLARVKLPNLRSGRHTVAVAYLGDKGVAAGFLGSVATIQVAKTPAALTATIGTVKAKAAAKTTTAPKAKTARIAAGQTTDVKIKITARGIDQPTGTVKAVIAKAGKKHKTVKITLRRAHHGQITATLPKLAKGAYTLTIKYTGNGYITKKNAQLLKLKAN
ncbi:MAG: fibronectin type III domain-containing protein [Bifidobacteriaceae bacterium]|nr:fibronectin type III domain-containing protein [Bifidobacteriaceae bacterium]